MNPEKNPETKASISPARPYDLADLVAYADGGIVSRTLADNPAGSLALFSFDAGQGLSEHSAPYDAFVYVLQGQAELTIGGKTVSADSGQMVIMPANIPHSLRATGRFKMLLTMLRTG